MDANRIIEQFVKMDGIWDRETIKFYACYKLKRDYNGPSPLFLEEKYLDGIDIIGLAKKWRVSRKIMKIYVSVQRYINKVFNNEWRDLPSPEDIALSFDPPIPPIEFKNYVTERVQEIREAHAEEEEVLSLLQNVEPEPWDTEAALHSEAEYLLNQK